MLAKNIPKKNLSYDEIIRYLKSLRNQKNIDGMARFGLQSKNTLGISMTVLRTLGKNIGKNHELALRLYDSEIHEAMILATLVAEADKVSEVQMEKWVKEFDSWGICDQACQNLFSYTKFAHKKALEWSSRHEEYVKRAGFVLMARTLIGSKSITFDDEKRASVYFRLMIKHSTDSRNYVRKAVNWALRQIGKSGNEKIWKMSIECANDILRKHPDDKTARWIAKDALRELQTDYVKKQVQKKESGLHEGKALRVTSRGIIIKENKVLLIRRFKNDTEYFVFPGGHSVESESPAQTCIREVKEETGLSIKIKKKFFTLKDKLENSENYFFLIDNFSGNVKLGGPEKKKNSAKNKYSLEWHDLSEIGKLNIVPRQVALKLPLLLKKS